MTRSQLFAPSRIGGLNLANRIIISPMCQYSAVEGRMTDWHLMHLGHLALSGAGMLTIEATAVEAAGRISASDTGLYDDASEAAMATVVDAVRQWSPIPIALQLAHAGRKASTDLPWSGGGQLAPDHPRGWQAVAPSPIAFGEHTHPPTALDRSAMDGIRDAFVASSRRAAAIGLDAVQVHAAHGYLLHQFLSPLSNLRTDAYGGSRARRMRFPLEVFAAVREAFPPERPVTVRVSATDWIDGGWTLDDTIAFAQALEKLGCDALDVSSGGTDPAQQIPVAPGYQVPLARAIRNEVSMPVMAVGLITAFDQAEQILARGDADFVCLARGMLYDPRWPWHAAAALGERVSAPPQYRRSQPTEHPDLFDHR